MLKFITNNNVVMADDIIDIYIKFDNKLLPPFQKILVKSYFNDDSNNTFVSTALFMTNINNEIYINQTTSLGGSYNGIASMGLIYSAKADKNCKPGTRFFKRDVTKPLKWNIDVYKVDNNIDMSDLVLNSIKPFDKNLKIWKSSSILRHYLHPYNVKRIEICEIIDNIKIYGTLFIPNNTPAIGVVDMFGSAGGLIEYRSALLANNGFVALALPFFNFADLPKKLNQVKIEYFAAAVKWLATSKYTLSTNKIAIVGVSTGALWALRIACYVPNLIAAIVPICGIHSFMPIEELVDNSKIITVADHEYALDLRYCYDRIFDDKRNKKYDIPIEIKGKCAILFLTGDDDGDYPSSKSAKFMMKNLQQQNYPYQYLHLNYPNTGHLIEPIYAPFTSFSYHGTVSCYLEWGGEVNSHNAAQVHSWKTLLSFLKYHCNYYNKNTSKL